MTMLTMAKALNAGLRRALEADPKVVIAGEDVGKLGGVFRVTEGLQKDFGEHRVIDSPLAESGIVGTAVGMALRGYRPVCEIQFDGFVYPAFDQIVSQASRLHYRSRGLLEDADRDPDPLRRRNRSRRAPQRIPRGLLLPHAGLKVVTCSNPVDAYWMIQQAVAIGRPDHLLRTQAALSRARRGGRVRDPGAIAFRAGGATRNRRHLDRVRTHGQDLSGRGRSGHRGRS